MASSSPITFSISLLFVSFLSYSSLSYASRASSPFINNNNKLVHHRLSPAQRLIRSLNLFPKKAANIIRAQLGEEAISSFVPRGTIVERKFSFLADSGPSINDLGHHAGYYSLPQTKDARMFYFFFESRNSKDDPVVIWLTGGPGCGSEIALFYENGPFHITKNLSLIWNDYGWDKASNILFVDQPIGTGFSYSSSESDIPHDEKGVSNDLYNFLQAFFKEHSDFVKNDFYITGESYGGHYIPALASRIHQGNKKQEGILINLKGFAIGNGLTNPEIQYQAYTDFALDNKLITKSNYDDINKIIPQCVQGIKSCASESDESSCVTAKIDCDRVFNRIMSDAGDNLNYYDIRKKCEGSLCYDFSKMENLMNKKEVKKALGVGDIEFVSCSDIVYEDMAGDWMKNLESGIPALLEDGIRLLVYAGEEDFICNWLGNSRWVDAMEWSGQKEYKDSPIVQFKVDGAEAGSLKSHGPLSFLKVHEAGHMVPMDQPKAALEMFTRWMKGNLAVARKIDN